MTPVVDALAGDFDALPGLGELGDRVSTLLRRQREFLVSSSSAWAIVPVPSGAGITWWLVADDTEEERRAHEVLGAFFGPTLIAGAARRQGSEVPATIAGIARAHSLGPAGDLSRFVGALELMTSVRASAPDLRRELPDPISYLLRDFYLAIDQHDSRLSEQLLERIENTGLVGSENLRFLRVERLAGLGYWSEVAALPWFEELSRARRPLRVTEQLLEAIWRAEFDEASIAGDPDVAATTFEAREIVERFGSVVNAIDVPGTTSGRRLALLFAHRLGDAARVDRILAESPETERGFLDLLSGRAAPVAPADTRSPLDRARDLFDDGDYNAVVTLAESDATAAMTALAVRAAFELNDPRLAGRALDLTEQIGRAALPDSPGFERILAAVQRLAQNRCGSWLEWLGRVQAEERWADAAEVARDLSPTWESSFESTQAATAAADALLRAADGLNGREVRASLDLLCSAARGMAHRPAADAFVDAVLLVLSADDSPSVLVRAAFFDLVLAVLDAGPSAERYRDLTATAETLWRRVRSRDAIPWLLDVLDLLASRPAPEPGARATLVSGATQSLWDLAERMPLDERRLLEAIADDCAVVISLPAEHATASEDADVWSRLSGKLVGLYSLLDGVGDRLRKRLEGLAPDVRVTHNNDTVASDALRSLAATADYLLVDTRHASHSATGAIDSERARAHQLFPTGGGLSSFIARLRDALEQGL